MFVSYHELKEMLYKGQTILAAFFILVAFYQFYLATSTLNPISHILTALILTFVGGICLFFGIETYNLRDDPEIWR